MLVRDIMSREIVAVDPDATVTEALARMEQHGIHELPVMQNSSLKGWVNYDALIQRARLPPQSKVTSIMTPAPKIAQDTDFVSAADVMIRQNVRAVPVTDAKGNIVGILSRTDLMRAAAQAPAIAGQTLDKVMTRELETVPDTASIDEAARRLRELSIRQLLVLNAKGKLMGVVGREVVVHTLSSEDKSTSLSRGKFGHIGSAGRYKDRAIDLKGIVEAPLTMAPGATLGEAIRAMLKNHKTSVVVVDEGFPVGIVARANVLERLAARAVVEGPWVQVIGLQNHVDTSVLDQVHAYARQALSKVEKEFRIEFLSLHYKMNKPKTEGDVLFSVRAHLSTETKFLVSTADDWDPLRATKTALNELERRAFETKEIRLTRRKASPRRGADFYTAV